MPAQPVRRPAVAGSWYPGTASALAREVDRYLAAVPQPVLHGTVRGLVAPHAGLVYSGPVAAWAYRAVQGLSYDVVVLVGPSHHVGFDGVAVYPAGVFETPLGPVAVADEVAAAVMEASPVVHEYAPAHQREHSLEMQLPFLKRVLPDVPIVPLVMGYQTPGTIRGLGEALVKALAGRRPLLVASSDLSHYLDGRTAAATDRVILDLVGAYRPEGVLAVLDDEPHHACGGGAIVSVMEASRALGARDSRVLRYADSGGVSGDKSAVVGYMAAAFGEFAS
jgi:AmmeMemoRadiSam system protein B